MNKAIIYKLMVVGLMISISNTVISAMLPPGVLKSSLNTTQLEKYDKPKYVQQRVKIKITEEKSVDTADACTKKDPEFTSGHEYLRLADFQYSNRNGEWIFLYLTENSIPIL